MSAKMHFASLWHLLVEVSPLVEIGRCCTSVFTHGQCNQIAPHLVFWPGREPVPRCDACCAWSRHVADALGFALHVTPLAVWRRADEPEDATSARFAAMELT